MDDGPEARKYLGDLRDKGGDVLKNFLKDVARKCCTDPAWGTSLPWRKT